jgi:putative transposase
LAQHRVPRAFAMDEARFGRRVWFRRRWCPKGIRPPWIVADRYEWLCLYAAIEPTTGESFFLCLRRLDGECFAVFLREFRQAFPEGTLGLVLDNSGSHSNRQIQPPAGIELVGLPPYSPELNPTERLFEALRGELAHVGFESRDALEQALTTTLRTYWEHPSALVRLTAYCWWRAGVEHITTSLA